MDIITTLEKALLEGYATSEITIRTMFICEGFTALIALFIGLVYKLTHRNSFFNRNFHLSLFALSVITASIILTIQSNIVVSLGMVGALSIVRFRTAVKDPMDLVFLFWSISIGIICGAGFAMIAIIGSVILAIGILLFSLVVREKDSMILVINSQSLNEKEIIDVVKQYCRNWKVRARNVTSENMNMAIEVKTKRPNRLIGDIMEVDHVVSASLVEHDGDITA